MALAKLTGAQMVWESLLKERVEYVFGLPGGASLSLYHVLPDYPGVKHILVRHEQGAAMAADGYARATGRAGVCTATSGPGATNLVTGIACAYMDSTPVVAITAQVGRASIGQDVFQETDITGITLPITKHNYLVMSAAELPRTIKEAFYIATTGRPGPVLIDIPRDVLAEEAEFNYPDTVEIPGYKPTVRGNVPQIRRAAALLNQSQRPIIIAGHGVTVSRAFDQLRALAEKAQIPVTTTFLGVSSFLSNHPLSLGMCGMHGRVHANLAIKESDLVIGLGTRFVDRVTGRLDAFAPQAKVIHVDIDPSELGKNVHVDIPIVGDLAPVLETLVPLAEQKTREEWIARMAQLRKEHPPSGDRQTDALIPQHIIRRLSDLTEGKALVVTGVGQHQMWTAQNYSFRDTNTLISSGGLGSMGFEVPAAVGAQLGRPDKTVWAICGDGGFQMTMFELATVVENQLPIKFAIMNNKRLGMVRQQQEVLFGKRYVAVTHTGSPDFVLLAKAYGIHGIRVSSKAEVEPAIREAMGHKGAVILDFQVEPEENLYPFIPPGKTVADVLEERR
jgi:acetolactate synthase-1/2/3 large subunit